MKPSAGLPNLVGLSIYRGSPFPGYPNILSLDNPTESVLSLDNSTETVLSRDNPTETVFSLDNLTETVFPWIPQQRQSFLRITQWR
jgi:hypothetical protein